MADCDHCRDGDCPRCDIFTCSCAHERVTSAGVRYVIREPDAELLAEIERAHAEHPTDRCDLFRTKTGRCTCEGGSDDT